MHLVQMLVPIYDNAGQRFPAAALHRIRRELTASFGGVTAYTRAPAQGAWEDEEGRVHHDDVVVIEVIVERLDRVWWTAYRTEVADRLRQATLLVRATAIELL